MMDWMRETDWSRLNLSQIDDAVRRHAFFPVLKEQIPETLDALTILMSKVSDRGHQFPRPTALWVARPNATQYPNATDDPKSTIIEGICYVYRGEVEGKAARVVEFITGYGPDGMLSTSSFYTFAPSIAAGPSSQTTASGGPGTGTGGMWGMFASVRSIASRALNLIASARPSGNRQPRSLALAP